MRQRPVPNAWWIEQFGCPAQVSPWISRVISPWVSYGFSLKFIHWPLQKSAAPKRGTEELEILRQTAGDTLHRREHLASRPRCWSTQRRDAEPGHQETAGWNWSLTYIFIISSSSSSRVVAAVLFRANPPVRPHNFLGILKEYKVRPLGRSTRALGIHSIGKINMGIRNINSHPR